MMDPLQSLEEFASMASEFGDPDFNPAPTKPRSSFLLVVSAHSTSLTDGRWQFVIETSDGQPVMEADDQEFGDLNRLSLLAAVRGLEAIDGPSGITLLSHNRYLIRSLTDSLPRWRRSDFVWDHFGRRVEVQHADLWRRVDHALGIHEVQACLVTSRLVSRKPEQVTPDGAIPAAEVEDSVARTSTKLKDDWSRIDHSHAGPPAPKSSRTVPTANDRLRDWLLSTAVSANGIKRSNPIKTS
ncbi:ribonuclease H family protein [Rhodopirellula bahusiensis]|uniref:Ribonuclease HI n=1 Tax=Rhodopirellula bahusiensis TaxID=2014065 RepID=A0A2G1W2U7_9BACT|nr:ribonuclease HI [Rhodopirellula bahusiensis]PHQ33358.1 ribonuclease HI [Rhodopirellula bahusiensis]